MLFGDIEPQVREILKSSATAFFFKISATVLNFVYNALLARKLGADGIGVYFLAATIVTISSVIARLGLDNAMLRYVALHSENKNWSGVLGVYKIGMKATFLLSSIIAISIYYSSTDISQKIFAKQELSTLLKIMSISIVPYSLLTLYSELLKGIKMIRSSLFVNGLAIPSVCIPIFLIIINQFDIVYAAISYTVATAITLVVAHYFWITSVPIEGVRAFFDSKLLFSTSLPLFLVAIMNLLIGWSDIIILGILLDSKSVGVYSIVLRVAAMTGFVLFAVNSIVAPKFAALYDSRDMTALTILARLSAKIMIISTFPVLLAFIIFPSWLLSLFGPEFKEGAIALVILSLGQFVNVSTGPVGYLLIMTGNQKAVQNATFFAAVSNVVLISILAPVFGINGAAAGSAISLAIMNIFLFWIVRWKLNIIIFPTFEIIIDKTNQLLYKVK